jgi:hypothetical protein
MHHRLAELTTFENEDEQNSAPSADSEMNSAFKEGDFDELQEQADADSASEYPPTVSNENVNDGYDQNNDSYEEEDDGSVGRDTQPSSGQSSRAEMGTAPANPTSSFAAPPQIQSKYQEKIQANFLNMIAPKTNSTKYSIPSIDGDSAVVHQRGRKMRHAAVQTTSIPFGPSVDTKYLLGEIRPWGNRAQFLPQKGLGLYYSRNPNHLAHAAKLDAKLEVTQKIVEASQTLYTGKKGKGLVPDVKESSIMVTNSKALAPLKT